MRLLLKRARSDSDIRLQKRGLNGLCRYSSGYGVSTMQGSITGQSVPAGERRATSDRGLLVRRLPKGDDSGN